MRERPILFSAPMIRMILAGRKSMTRRIVSHRRPWEVREFGGKPTVMLEDANGEQWEHLLCPYGLPGDHLWCKETFGHEDDHREHGRGCVVYRADKCPRCVSDVPCEHGPSRWHSPRFMPRWASRITLVVTSVRLERLQSISDRDARAEGVELGEMQPARINGELGEVMIFSRKAFAVLWDQINGKRAPWSSNPWCWVISFERLEAQHG
jgi:hypothetical protein